MRLSTPMRLVGAVLAVSMLAAAPAAIAPEGSGEDTSPFGLDAHPAPSVTGEQLVDTVANFVTTFPNRTTGGLDELLASQFLADTAAGFGYESEVTPLPVLAGLPDTGPIRVVTAFKEGTDLKDEVMLFIAHYDTLPQSLQGAYDNGSGTSMLLGLAESLKDVDTRRSVMFAWYNGEEEGVLASSRHVAKLKADGVHVEVVMGFDMVGIAFPVATPTATTCMCMWHGQDDAAMGEVLRTVNHDYLAYPAGPFGGAQVIGNNVRNSDERSWESAGAVTMRWAGLKAAGTYSQYHMPRDNMETIYAQAGGRSFFEQGMRNTLVSAYYTALAVDSIDEPGGNF